MDRDRFRHAPQIYRRVEMIDLGDWLPNVILKMENIYK